MTKWSTGRVAEGSADWIVLEVVREGRDTLRTIAAAANVEERAAYDAIARLVKAKKVKALNGRKNRRYVPAGRTK